MKDIINITKIELPRFLLNFTNILFSPKSYVLGIINLTESDEEKFSKALFYFTVSYLIIGTILTIPLFGEEKYQGIINYLFRIVIALVFLLLSTAAINLSWRIVGIKIAFAKCLIPFAYHIGTVLSVLMLIQLMNLSVLKYFSIIDYNRIFEFTYGSLQENPYEDMFSRIPILFYALINNLSVLGVIIWSVFAWGVYREISNVSKSKSLIAGALFSFFILTIIFIITVISKNILNL